MPCDDNDRGCPPSHGMYAALCGVLTVLELISAKDSVLGNVDWDEVGMTRDEVEDWWEDHKERDRERRAWEAREDIRDTIARRVWDKLSPEEREALSGRYIYGDGPRVGFG